MTWGVPWLRQKSFGAGLYVEPKVLRHTTSVEPLTREMDELGVDPIQTARFRMCPSLAMGFRGSAGSCNSVLPSFKSLLGTPHGRYYDSRVYASRTRGVDSVRAEGNLRRKNSNCVQLGELIDEGPDNCDPWGSLQDRRDLEASSGFYALHCVLP